MKIKTRLQLSMTISITSAIVVIVAIILVTRQNENDFEKSKQFYEMEQKVYALNLLTDAYLLHAREQVKEQWESVHRSLGAILEHIEVGALETRDLLEVIRTNHQELTTPFSQLVTMQTTGNELPFSANLKEMLVNRISVQLGVMLDSTERLVEISQARIAKSQQRVNILSILIVLGIASLGALLALMGNRILRSIVQLHEAVGLIAQEKWDHRIEVKGDDEIADLALAFNDMSARLGSSYSVLEAEIAERKKIENALHESEKQYERAEQVARFGHWDWNFATNEVAWSEETYRILRVSSKEFDPSFESFLSLVHPDDREVLKSAIETSVSHRKPLDLEYRIILRDGKEGFIHAVGEIRFDEKDQAVGMFGTIHDITQQKEAEEKIKATMEKLEQSNKALDDFASIASHDMQEPLRKILAFGDRLKDQYGENLGETGKDYLERMQKAAKRMQTLLQALLDYSRISSKAEPFRPVDLNELVRDVIEDLEVRISQTGGSVKVENLPILESAPHQMRQLFQNLIGNALKFHREEEKPVIRICGSLGRDVRFCEILVEDNGIGFDEKYIERIFAPFQRLHGRSAYEGTGMGLAICRKIVEYHHGSITARSKPGQGTTFIINLPEKQSAHSPSKDHPGE